MPLNKRKQTNLIHESMKTTNDILSFMAYDKNWPVFILCEKYQMSSCTICLIGNSDTPMSLAMDPIDLLGLLSIMVSISPINLWILFLSEGSEGRLLYTIDVFTWFGDQMISAQNVLMLPSIVILLWYFWFVISFFFQDWCAPLTFCIWQSLLTLKSLHKLEFTMSLKFYFYTGDNWKRLEGTTVECWNKKSRNDEDISMSKINVLILSFESSISSFV